MLCRTLREFLAWESEHVADAGITIIEKPQDHSEDELDMVSDRAAFEAWQKKEYLLLDAFQRRLFLRRRC